MKKVNNEHLKELEKNSIPPSQCPLINAIIARGDVSLGILPEDMTEKTYYEEFQAQIQKYVKDREAQKQTNERYTPSFKMV